MKQDQSELLIETAKVVEVTEHGAVVECISRSACSACSKAEDCGNSSLAKAFPSRVHRFEVATPLKVAPGEQVELGLPAKQLVRHALLVYLLPLVCLVLGSAGGALLGAANGSSEGLSIAGAGIGLALGFVLSRRLSRQQSGNHAKPSIVGVHQGRDKA
ncbi:SoxR reducing system RseC family protein [Aliagarivorans taiwanensis]|uniref:SoxR reducing system RseC family protein n=1 Tax=Aliagarivorans taiwanensis TaxID=561966 RepID=UPI00040EA037|nr:SoxR reducing system RseC family protein [Aliagarivorans taiwanensis]